MVGWLGDSLFKPCFLSLAYFWDYDLRAELPFEDLPQCRKGVTPRGLFMSHAPMVHPRLFMDDRLAPPSGNVALFR